MAKVTLNGKKNLFTSKLDLHLRKKLVLHLQQGAETWILQKVDHKCLES
jgi:hypothetical protein